MAKYRIEDFSVGDKVYHLSNSQLQMVVIEINKTMNEISCRWVDKSGISQREQFMSEELGKSGDIGPSISVINFKP